MLGELGCQTLVLTWDQPSAQVRLGTEITALAYNLELWLHLHSGEVSLQEYRRGTMCNVAAAN
jgi:hypothetical protein